MSTKTRFTFFMVLCAVTLNSCEGEGAEVWHTLWVSIIPHLADLAETLILLGIPVLMWQIKQWLGSKIHSASFNCAMEKISKTLETSILKVAHTYVKDVKANGAWGGEAGANAKALAISDTKEMLGPKGIAEIKGCLKLKDDATLDSLFSNKLEEVLAKSKVAGWVNPPPAPTATVTVNQAL